MTYKTKDVCKRLDGVCGDAIIRFIDGENGITVPITYNIFELLMMEDGWILSEKTVLQKWNLLIKMGVIKKIPYSNGKALVIIDKMAEIIGYSSEKKNKKINFEIVNAEEVRI